LKKESSKSKILFCSSFTPPVNAGGGQNAFNFAKFLSEKNYKVTLLSLNRRGKLPSRSTSDELIIKRILYFNQNIASKVLSLFIILPNYFWYVAKSKLIFIYGGNIIGYEFIILIGRIFGKKVIFRSTMLGEDDVTTIIQKSAVLKPVRKWILGLMSYYFSINPEFTQSYIYVFGNNHNIIESVQGVDTRYFHPVRKYEIRSLRNKLGLPEDLLLIITVGFLVKRKGFTEIFKALEKLDIPFLYVIVGDFKVDKSHYLYHLRKEMNFLYDLGTNLLNDKILFTGPKENVNEYLQASDLFLLNSKREGVPNALLEAMACGKVCVVKSIIGIDQFISFHNENSMVFTKPQDIVPIIKDLNKNNKLCKRLEEKSFQTISANFSSERLLDILLKKGIL